MPSDRPWSDTDRELVVRAWWSSTDPRYGPITPMDLARADAVLDALTAAGWRRERNAQADVLECVSGMGVATHVGAELMRLWAGMIRRGERLPLTADPEDQSALDRWMEGADRA